MVEETPPELRLLELDTTLTGPGRPIPVVPLVTTTDHVTTPLIGRAHLELVGRATHDRSETIDRRTAGIVARATHERAATKAIDPIDEMFGPVTVATAARTRRVIRETARRTARATTNDPVTVVTVVRGRHALEGFATTDHRVTENGPPLTATVAPRDHGRVVPATTVRPAAGTGPPLTATVAPTDRDRTGPATTVRRMTAVVARVRVDRTVTVTVLLAATTELNTIAVGLLRPHGRRITNQVRIVSTVAVVTVTSEIVTAARQRHHVRAARRRRLVDQRTADHRRDRARSGYFHPNSSSVATTPRGPRPRVGVALRVRVP
jgi:hypothetical protein